MSVSRVWATKRDDRAEKKCGNKKQAQIIAEQLKHSISLKVSRADYAAARTTSIGNAETSAELFPTLRKNAETGSSHQRFLTEDRAVWTERCKNFTSMCACRHWLFWGNMCKQNLSAHGCKTGVASRTVFFQWEYIAHLDFATGIAKPARRGNVVAKKG